MSSLLRDPRSDGEDGRTASVVWRDAFHIYEEGDEEAVVVLETGAQSRIRAATNAIQSLVALLHDREATMDVGHDSTLSSHTVAGLLDAIACCAELAADHAAGSAPLWTTTLNGEALTKVMTVKASQSNGKRSQQAAQG